MVLITNNPKMWLIGMGVSLGIFLILLFAVILPANNTANNAVKSGLQQSQQALNQAQQQLSSAQKQGGAAGSTAGQASQTVSKAQKLTACLASAGTDISKSQQCQAQFAH